MNAWQEKNTPFTSRTSSADNPLATICYCIKQKTTSSYPCWFYAAGLKSQSCRLSRKIRSNRKGDTEGITYSHSARCNSLGIRYELLPFWESGVHGAEESCAWTSSTTDKVYPPQLPETYRDAQIDQVILFGVRRKRAPVDIKNNDMKMIHPPFSRTSISTDRAGRTGDSTQTTTCSRDYNGITRVCSTQNIH